MQKIIVIGGGASGLACAVMLSRAKKQVTVLERGLRVGRKLAATGNGQGNVTNLAMGAEYYFSDDNEKVERALGKFGAQSTVDFLSSLGGIFLPDERGRVYPCGRQASAVCDLFRFELEKYGVEMVPEAQVERIEHDRDFTVTWKGGGMSASHVVLAAGGMAAPNFGTDGNAYALAKRFGHSVTPLSPALVPLSTEQGSVRGLKGIKTDANLRVVRKNKEKYSCRGDVLFTDNGVSGDAVFKASSYAEVGDTLYIDFLPDVSRSRLGEVLARTEGERALLCVVPNGLGRFLYKLSGGNKSRLSELLKNYPLTVTGHGGFRRAQVTKGGIPLNETDENLQSKLVRGLYFTGEILNVDGVCGGYNLQWAFTSAYLAAEGIKSC